MKQPKMEKPKPSIYLSDEDAKKFDDKDVDDEFPITAKVRVASKSKRSFKDENGKIKHSHSMDLELSGLNLKQDAESRLEGKEF